MLRADEETCQPHFGLWHVSLAPQRLNGWCRAGKLPSTRAAGLPPLPNDLSLPCDTTRRVVGRSLPSWPALVPRPDYLPACRSSAFSWDSASEPILLTS